MLNVNEEIQMLLKKNISAVQKKKGNSCYKKLRRQAKLKNNYLGGEKLNRNILVLKFEIYIKG